MGVLQKARTKIPTTDKGNAHDNINNNSQATAASFSTHPVSEAVCSTEIQQIHVHCARLEVDEARRCRGRARPDAGDEIDDRVTGMKVTLARAPGSKSWRRRPGLPTAASR